MKSSVVSLGSGFVLVMVAAGCAATAPDMAEFRRAPDGFQVEWAADTNRVYTVESAEWLAPYPTFAPLITGLMATGATASCTIPLPPDPSVFYRVADAAAYTNPLGRALIISDMHLSPFLSSAVATQLWQVDVAEWDSFFAAATNGYFTADATTKAVTTPRLLDSALTNAWAACPNPDAVILPGDFPYYDLTNFYRHITGDTSADHGRALLLKTVDYVLLKVRQYFPATPIYFSLGNNDTYLTDYDITEGDAFFTDTAPLFHAGLSNAPGYDYAAFVATYTNQGLYRVPFGRGEIISLETTFLSANYLRGTAGASNQLVYLETQLAACAAAGRPAWILAHIPPGVDAYDTWSHWRTGQTEYAATDWTPGFPRRFMEILATYSGTVASVFSGHSHTRYWYLANDPATSNVTAVIHVANGILYNHGNNPGFTVVTYDRTTLAPQRELTYSLDYTTWRGRTGPAPWFTRYSANLGCGVRDLSAASLLAAWINMANPAGALGSYYGAEYDGGRTPAVINSTNWPVYYNALRWVLPEQFLENVPAPSVSRRE